jgi:hypothetical protein
MPERSDEPIRAIHTQCLCARSYMTLANPKTVKFLSFRRSYGLEALRP